MRNSLEIPKLLLRLIESGRWPSTPQEESAQNLDSFIVSNRVRLFAADEERIYLYAPPFSTVDEEARTNKFWHDFGALKEIDPSLSLIIGDFGLGSDTAIILDYRQAPPTVLRLKWSYTSLDGKRTEWVKGACSFNEFAEMLGLQDASSDSAF